MQRFWLQLKKKSEIVWTNWKPIQSVNDNGANILFPQLSTNQTVLQRCNLCQFTAFAILTNHPLEFCSKYRLEGQLAVATKEPSLLKIEGWIFLFWFWNPDTIWYVVLCRCSGTNWFLPKLYQSPSVLFWIIISPPLNFVTYIWNGFNNHQPYFLMIVKSIWLFCKWSKWPHK